MSVRAFLAVGLLFTSAPLAAAAADPAPLFGIARLPSIVAAGVLILWLTAVVAYFVWAIRRYNENYGLTDAEWKVLYPGLYASEKERPQYERLHEDYVASRLAGGAGEDRAAVLAPLAAPRKNPYGRDSFGLPPGTVRGALALTAAVMFIAIEIVNLFEPDTETRFAQLVTAFQMVLAFYFGSRAVEVLQAAQRSPAAKEGVAGRASPSVEAAQPAAREPVPARGVTAPAISAPAEQAVMPASQRPFRLDSIVTVAAKALLPARVVPGPLSPQTPLAARILALTASFETGRGFPDCFGAVAGDFDQQGLSFGALQWCIGQGSLQALWRRMLKRNDQAVREALGDLHGDLLDVLERPRSEQLRWARAIQTTRTVNGRTTWVVNDRWARPLAALGIRLLDVQVEDAANRYDVALGWCRELGVASERAAALMFDINVQNGKLDRDGVGDRIRADFERLPGDLGDAEAEQEKLVIVATRRADLSKPQWRQDVLDRKLTIARGGGVAHGRRYDVERDFSISLERPFDAGAPAAAVVAV